MSGVDFSDVGALLTRPQEVGTGGGPSAWRIVSYCSVPSVTIKNLETGEERHFGVGGTMAQGWKLLAGSERRG